MTSSISKGRRTTFVVVVVVVVVVFVVVVVVVVVVFVVVVVCLFFFQLYSWCVGMCVCINCVGKTTSVLNQYL